MTTELTIWNEQWYQRLIDDCKTIIIETEFVARITVIEGKHQVGKRILEDEYRLVSGGSDMRQALSRVTKFLPISERELYRCVQFARLYPDLSLLPRGKAISWHYIVNKLLAQPKQITTSPSQGDLFEVYCGDFRDICQQREPETIDTIITDPPYNLESVSLYSDLGKTASRLLKPNGSLLIMSGNMYLPVLLNSLSEHLQYQWQIAFVMGMGTSRVWDRKVCQMWKPILWFVKGQYKGDWVTDLFKSKQVEKELNEWQQPESVFTWLVERFSEVDDYILDPMMGTGTTGVATIKLERHFIGIDISEVNESIARERLKNVKRIPQ